MLIVNADDWGRSKPETDAALACFKAGRVTSVTAMMFMEDSERAAEVAREHKMDVGLHLNLNQAYDGRLPSAPAVEAHRRVARFLNRSKYAVLLYHPGLRHAFKQVFNSQLDEFVRLYGKTPTHVDGHQHRHLCVNVLIGGVIPSGTKVRRNFTFFAGQKSLLNRWYRALLDRWLARQYSQTAYFFSLLHSLRSGRIADVGAVASHSSVELMTHPIVRQESQWLLGEEYAAAFNAVRKGSYANI